MCGFLGQLRKTNTFSDTLREPKVSHRGPDSRSRIQFGLLDVAFFRLAINGISNGSQPFIDVESGLVTVVNGEIYNHLELRDLLSAKGVTFLTDSDAEVVHWGFSVFGTGIFAKLEGMFAVAIYERNLERLTFARDRLGKKPLYWVESPESLWFSSEIGGLPLDRKQLSTQHVLEYLITDAITWEGIQPAGVSTVPGGHWFQWSMEGKVLGQFWSVEEEVSSLRELEKSDDEWLDGFLDVLRESVKDRLMSEVPVGLFLSDGKDSKLVAALASEMGKIDVAYTLQFPEKTHDESDSASEFAKWLGIPHQIVNADLDALASAWETYRQQIDEPVADSAILGEYLLAASAQGRTKVVLTGDGGDEVLLGYQHVLAHQLSQYRITRAALGFVASGLKPLTSNGSEKYFSPAFIIDRFLRGAKEDSLLRRDLAWRASFTIDLAQSFLLDSPSNAASEILERLAGEFPPSASFPGWQDRWSFLYLRTYLPHIILRKVDRATMRFGVEARSPLLDHKVVEFALAMPLHLRRRLLRPKVAIDQALRKVAGPKFSRGRKHGMGIPLTQLLQGPLEAEVTSLLDEDFLSDQRLFRREALVRLVGRFRESPQAHVREIWSILVFQNWWKNQFVEPAG